MIIRKFCDLDNTLIFSHRLEIGDKNVVEYLNGKEHSFMPQDSYEELQRQGRTSIIPLSSRTIEQYNRIKLFRNGDVPEYALLDNGGVLIVNGVEDVCWRSKTYQLILQKREIMADFEIELKKYGNVKLQDNLVLFLKSDIDGIIEFVKSVAEDHGFIVFNHLKKIYICPSELSKGNAIRRFVSKYGADYVISAGDAKIDCSMIYYSDRCILSNELKCEVGDKKNVKFVDNQQIGMELLKEK